MGWLDRLTGQKKVTEDPIPENFDTLLESAIFYQIQSLALAMAHGHSLRKEKLIQEKIGSGVPAEQAEAEAEALSITDDFNRPAPMPTMMMVTQFSSQMAMYAAKPSLSLTYLGTAVSLARVLNMEDFARSSAVEPMIAAHDKAVAALIAIFRTPPETLSTLSSDTAAITTGIVVGNRMAQDFFSQLHAQKEPEVGDDVTGLFQRHLLLNGRRTEDKVTFDIEPTAFVPDVGKWLSGEAPEALTVTAKGSRAPSW